LVGATKRGLDAAEMMVMMDAGSFSSTEITLLGLLAASCSTFAFLPQVIKTWQTRSTKDISLGMFLVLVAGIVLWLIYGLMIRDIPLIVANVVTLLFAGIILCFKLRYG
jgi:MtN3 and saliva related transmembrane protein